MENGFCNLFLHFYYTRRRPVDGRPSRPARAAPSVRISFEHDESVFTAIDILCGFTTAVNAHAHERRIDFLRGGVYCSGQWVFVFFFSFHESRKILRILWCAALLGCYWCKLVGKSHITKTRKFVHWQYLLNVLQIAWQSTNLNYTYTNPNDRFYFAYNDTFW